MSYTEHYSVLKNECLEYLTNNIQENNDVSYFADLTFGGGGHTFALLNMNEKYHLRSVDQDPDALANGRKRIETEKVSERITLIDSNFEKFPAYIQENEKEVVGKFQGILADLGVSSHHFDEGSRGFSFRFEAPLDMRMDYDNENIRTAKELINEESEEFLLEIIKEYGEEKHAWKIVQRIIQARDEKPIETTIDLENLIFHAYPKKERFGKTNPATKTFQALRIAVNRELDVITNVIPQLIELLKVNGRLAIITFHSLEDRIVKRAFKELENGEIPCTILTRKPILPSKQELAENPRSRSAKLRVIERVLEKKSKNKYAEFSKIEN
jgi:16S rRNA (cytosine1402-N4)-methyltransferase